MTVADMRPGLREFLLSDATILSLVVDRIFPVILKQGEGRASIVYSKISDIGDHHYQGPSGLARPRLQVDSWAPTADAADALGRAVKDKLDGAKGAFGAGANLITVQGAFYDSARDDYDDTVKMFRVSQDYFIWFEES